MLLILEELLLKKSIINKPCFETEILNNKFLNFVDALNNKRIKFCHIIIK